MISTEQRRKAEEWGRRQLWLDEKVSPWHTRRQIFDDDGPSLDRMFDLARDIGRQNSIRIEERAISFVEGDK